MIFCTFLPYIQCIHVDCCYQDCLCCITVHECQDKILGTEVLKKAEMQSMYTYTILKTGTDKVDWPCYESARLATSEESILWRITEGKLLSR